MAASLSDILAAMQNGVTAINSLRTQLTAFFPQVTSTSSAARGSVGAITFTSSQATAFIAVETSSGFIGWVPIYPSS